MKNIKKVLALTLVVVSVLAITSPALALTGGYTAATEYLYTYTLKEGANNNATAVRNLQIMLLNLGYNPGPIDGIYGPLTSGAVEDFQSDTPGLAVDGQCGRYTKTEIWAALDYVPYGCVSLWD